MTRVLQNDRDSEELATTLAGWIVSIITIVWLVIFSIVFLPDLFHPNVGNIFPALGNETPAPSPTSST